jgi:PEGA domain
MNLSKSICVTAIILAACASAGPQKRWVNELDPHAYYPKDDYECKQLVEDRHKDDVPNSTAGYGGPVAGPLSLLPAMIAKNNEHDQCMSARGWRLVAATPAAPEARVPITVASIPPGCDFWIDGYYIGVTPKSGHLKLGTHEIKIQKKGFYLLTRQIVALPETPINLSFELKSETP